MSQFLQVLPIELTDIIIDYLDTDICALKACSLVCKAWQARSRHHLFRSINLDLSLPPKSLDNFLCHVSRPISHFHITIHSLSLRSQCAPEQQYNLAVLASLRSLTHLTLLYWNVMPDARWFSGSPNVTYLRLESCRIDYPGFVALLQQFPKLECLQLKGVSWRGCFDIKQAKYRGKVLKHIRRFHLGANSMPVVPELTALISTGIIEGEVEEIVLEDVEMRNERIVGELLMSVGTFLRSLVISAKSRLRCTTRSFALKKNTNLKSIHFTDLVDPTHSAGYMDSRQLSFNWVMAMLNQLPDSIEQVTFSFWLIPSDKLGLDTDDGINWPKLVRVLGHLQRLTRVEIRLNAKKAHRQWIKKKCEQRFPEWTYRLQVTGINGQE